MQAFDEEFYEYHRHLIKSILGLYGEYTLIAISNRRYLSTYTHKLFQLSVIHGQKMKIVHKPQRLNVAEQNVGIRVS